MKLKRNRYSLRNCNPAEKMVRKKINELDFKVKFPFYSFDKDKIDMSLLRRFLYRNNIKSYQLYTEVSIEEQLKERNALPDDQKKFLPEDDMIDDRFEILDL